MQSKAAFAPAAWPVLCLLLATAPAWAQDDPGGQAPPGASPAGETPGADQAMGGLGEASKASGDRPWAEGVSPQDQQAAIKLFEEGNALLRDSLFAPAVSKYREALEHWDHPGIHYNLSLALLNLDRPIEVYHSLQRAMQYGAAPLDGDKHERAKSYLVLVEKQLARVEIACDEPDAKVSMDGKLLFTAPGRYEGILRVGEHTVVTTKRGYLTDNKSLALLPGEQVQLTIKLISLDEVNVTRRRWAQWMPWTVAGTGAAVALAGGVLHWRSSANYSGFDRQFNALCEQAGGCREDAIPELTQQLEQAERQQQIAVTSYLIGGAAVATGLVLVYLNRPRVFRKNIEEMEPAGVSFVPMLSPEATGMSAAFRF